MSKYAKGGWVGPGSPTNDGITVMLHGCSVHPQPHPKKIISDAEGNIECDGEFVIPASVVRHSSTAMLDWINDPGDA